MTAKTTSKVVGPCPQHQFVIAAIDRNTEDVKDLLRRQIADVRELVDSIASMKIDIAVLQVKAGIWGALLGGLAGLVPAVTAVLIVLLK